MRLVLENAVCTNKLCIHKTQVSTDSVKHAASIIEKTVCPKCGFKTLTTDLTQAPDFIDISLGDYGL